MKRLKVVSGIAALALTVGVATAGASLGGGGDVGGFGEGGCPPDGIGAPCVIDGTGGTDATGSTIRSAVLIGTTESRGDTSAGDVAVTEDGNCPPAGMGPCTIG